MAFSYLTQGQKDAISSVISNIHETFAVDIVVFKIGQDIALSTNPNYNAIYRKTSIQTQKTEESRTISARVRYLKMAEEVFDYKDGSSATATQSRVILPAGSVKIKVANDDHLYIKDAKRIEMDGMRFIIQHNPRPIGFFDKTQYWEYLLFPTD
jgi:hypothetical protein